MHSNAEELKIEQGNAEIFEDATLFICCNLRKMLELIKVFPLSRK